MSIKKSEIAESIANSEDATFVVGEKLLIRMVTYHVTGKIDRISQIGGVAFLHLSDAAWIADVGRFTQAIEKGELGEVEPVTQPIRVNIASIVDVYPWDHPLPRKQK